MFPNWETHAPQLGNMCTAIEKHDVDARFQILWHAFHKQYECFSVSNQTGNLL